MKPLYRPIGIADLKVMKQKLVRYEAGEVAHVETVMAFESRSREHRRLRRDTETVVSTQEREEESRRDLQSTERFELQHEVQNTIKTDTSFKAGVDLSGTFGPVSLSAYAKFDYAQSKEESDRLATNYAKEVVDKSLNRLVEKTAIQRTTTTLEEVEEVNKHGFANVTAVNASGVYRWLDKVYRAKVVDYGKRLFYEFVIPEPAAFHLFARAYKLGISDAPRKPDVPTHPLSGKALTPSDLDATTYRRLVAQYAVQGVNPPPAETIRLARGITREFPNDSGFAFTEAELKIPKEYVAKYYSVSGSAVTTGGVWDELVLVGIHKFNPGQTLPLPPEGLLRLSGSVPTSAIGVGHRAIVYHVVVTCTRTDEAMQAWQLATFGAIMQAYHKELSDYEDKAAALNVQSLQIGGRNPLLNRATEREELRRGCLAAWAPDALNNPAAITTGPSPLKYPEQVPPAVKFITEKVRFFERAFDWDNMVYEFLPYFWGRKPKWLELLSYEDPDPIFEKFLVLSGHVQIPSIRILD